MWLFENSIQDQILETTLYPLYLLTRYSTNIRQNDVLPFFQGKIKIGLFPCYITKAWGKFSKTKWERRTNTFITYVCMMFYYISAHLLP